MFAQFHAPLVEAEDIPDDALRKDFVFVHRYENTQTARRDLSEQKRIGGPIARKYLERQQLLYFRIAFAGGCQFGVDFFGGFAFHQRLRLGKEVGHQQFMMLANGVVTDRRRYKIAGNELGALMNELVKSVLAVGARFSPKDGACLVAHQLPVAVGIFAVALHIALLEIRREAAQVLVVGQDGFRFRSPKIIVPDTDDRQ